ncbi:hypothetical protein SAMN04488117_105227 [Celeribacter baekdonensis]|jgi:hypothetical protein|uniref:Uncharacterized protein n=1 Tax=Celeribacter baekdonensis TaxID=875171 RepID=A0A1G7MGU6_9RHOB|nr:hypothetical protein [Celeribacter baekdonensis]SDF60844.1 hypothetical protein SAMN04488117_105227 [Celeribacter baekdonensis]
MTAAPVALDELIATREKMLEIMVAQMPEAHRAFLVGIERGDVDWGLSGLTDAASLPAVRWKLSNLGMLSADRRETQAKNLEGIWQ